MYQNFDRIIVCHFFRWLQWARSKPELKVVCGEIPEGILPDGLQGELIDVKVFTKHGPDDAIYDCDKAIRDMVMLNILLQIITNNSYDNFDLPGSLAKLGL